MVLVAVEKHADRKSAVVHHADVDAALIEVGLGRFIGRQGNLATAQMLRKVAAELERRPRVLLADLEPEGHA